VAHLAAHAVADAVSLLVPVVAGLRHRGARTANPHAGADEGEEVECGTSEIPTGIKRAGAPPMTRRSGRPPRGTGSPWRSPRRGRGALRRLGALFPVPALGVLGFCRSPLQAGLGSGRGADYRGLAGSPAKKREGVFVWNRLIIAVSVVVCARWRGPSYPSPLAGA
jgi:hypothetical protein